MADFSHLKALAVTRETTREYTFDRIVGDPSVIVSPATDANRDFKLARLELSLADAPGESTGKPRKQSGQLAAEELADQYDKDREIDCKLIAQTCVRGWGAKAPLDSNGKPVEFTPENAYEFLLALPDYMMDPFRNFCVNIYNFIPKQAAKPDGVKLGKS